MTRTLAHWTLRAVAGIACCLAGSVASAGWGSYGSYGGMAGWSPAWGSYGSSGGWVSYGSHGSWGSYGSFGSYGSHGGPIRAALHGLFHHHRHYGGFYSCGSSGGMVSWGSYGSHGSMGSSPYYHAPMSPPKEAPAESEAPMMPMMPGEAQPQESKPNGTLPPPNSSTFWLDGESGTALLSVNVPASARVFVNGRPTSSTGALRRYISRGLQPGMSYTYEVRAEATINGETVEETQVVQLRAGDTARLEFRLQPKPETTLTLRVPSDARVKLAGNETSSTGEVRVFRSRALADGQEWPNYKVEVTVERDGRMITKEESITLKGGESRTLEFQFDSAQSVAAR